MADKFTDILTSVLSVAFAAIVLVFAAYKVVALNGMDNPPANMGLYFPPPKRKVIMDGAGMGDPLTTQSLGSIGDGRVTPSRVQRVGPPGASSYQLLTVVEGVAFVAVETGRETALVPVAVGTRLPGGPRVDAIIRRNGRWSVLAGPLRLEQVPLADQ